MESRLLKSKERQYDAKIKRKQQAGPEQRRKYNEGQKSKIEQEDISIEVTRWIENVLTKIHHYTKEISLLYGDYNRKEGSNDHFEWRDGGTTYEGGLYNM